MGNLGLDGCRMRRPKGLEGKEKYRILFICFWERIKKIDNSLFVFVYSCLASIGNLALLNDSMTCECETTRRVCTKHNQC